MRSDLGDYQTPGSLASAIVRCLEGSYARVLEPTCGRGRFIEAAQCLNPKQIIGIEVQQGHLDEARRSSGRNVTLIHGNLFEINLAELNWTTSGPLLVVGNPPWVTNAELGAMGSGNLPPKENVHNLSGLDALTGKSNFDIAEYIWIKLIRELKDQRPTIALLCKTAVARNVLKYLYDEKIGTNESSIRRIDAKRWFGASVDAGLFVVKLGDRANYSCEVYPDLHSDAPEGTLGVFNGLLISDVRAYEETRHLEGECPVQWRQGVKHDAAQVLELRQTPDGLENGFGEPVDVEREYVYPLMKSTDLHLGRPAGRRWVIVTQQKLGEDTRKLAAAAPRLWRYLSQHREVFEARKSSVYRNKPPFSMFGIGDYTFAPFKVAISGLHKTPLFRILGPYRGQPVVLDDTSYFTPCSKKAGALLVHGMVRHQTTARFIKSISFPDAKRPVTKGLLQRINLSALRPTKQDKFSTVWRSPA